MAVGTLLVAAGRLVEGGAALWHPGVLGGLPRRRPAVVADPVLAGAHRAAPASTAVFGLLMSLEPAVAALAGVVVLGQPLTAVLVVALVMVVTASVGHDPDLAPRGGAAEPEA